MITLCATLFILAAEPLPVPTGMELLYGSRPPLSSDGEPSVAIGIATGERRIELEVDRAQIDYYQRRVHRMTRPRRRAKIRISIGRSKPALRRYYVDVASVPFNDPASLERNATDWTAKGYDVEVIEQGTAIGIGGRMIDTRQYRLVLPTADLKSAQRLTERVHKETGVRAFVSSRLETIPWASLKIEIDGAPVGRATSYVRLTPLEDTTITARAIHYGAGYDHAGSEDRKYRGELYVVVDADGKLALVNVLGAEQLLRGVVPSEIFASSPDPALQAQAVAARNQLFAKLGHRHHADPFHLCSEQHCQVYTGTNREDARTDAAIRATRGELLFHDGSLVDTVYSSTCGGHTEDNDTVWGNDPDPALRARPDFDVAAHPKLADFANGLDNEELRTWLTHTPASYCARASKMSRKKFRWRRHFSFTEIDTLIARPYPHVGHVRKIRPRSRGRGGRIEVLEIIGDRGSVTLLHELPIRRTFANLNSGAFIVEMSDKGGFDFIGGGWGHGVGMCQIGAIGRAEAGQSYQTILGHYYNGSEVAGVYQAPMSGAR